MLKLQRVELMGFKSFSDRGEIVIHDTGVTAIVGPNGCGKSNVSDAIAWVLGEQSAKSLRGEKMEDVIFNGTRKRAPMGMAEVTITMSENDSEPTFYGSSTNGGSSNGGGADSNGHHAIVQSNGPNGHGPAVHGAAAGSRQIVVQRRLYRSGESVYLMNGKPCRLRDIQDVFLGTGLGPNSYAIIEQGRVGQLLSSKPMDRRSLIEEAAGITKFKAKRRLAESRLEAARLNLSRVNDILAEVDRQRNSLRRQAGKARRFIELRSRMRGLLSAVFATRADLLVHQQETVDASLYSIGDEGKQLEAEIENITGLVRQCRSDVEGQELKLEQTRIRSSHVELEHEKTAQRIERFEDQIKSLEERKVTLTTERARAEEDLFRNRKEQSIRAERLAEIEQERLGIARSIGQVTGALQELTSQRDAEERAIDGLRRKQFEIAGNEARIRNEILSRQDMMQRLAAQVQRLEREASEAQDLAAGIREQLEQSRNEQAGFQESMDRLKSRLSETERLLAELRTEHDGAVKSAAGAKSAEDALRNRLQTIGELAVRRAYSTESVQQFFNHVPRLDWAPLGILADFIEVDSSFEAIVEDFLRFELQYVVVQDRAQADRALAVVKDVTKGRMDCFLLNGEAVPGIPESPESPESPEIIDGARPLVSVLRLDPRVKHFADSIRDAYIVETLDRACALSRLYPHYRFIVRTGEVVRGHVIGWGEHEALGPLAVKREIRELDMAMRQATQETEVREADAVRLGERIREADILKAQLVSELQDVEKTLLTLDHRARSLTTDLGHVEERSSVAHAEIARFAEERRELELAVLNAQSQLSEIGRTKTVIEEDLQQRAQRIDELRSGIEKRRGDLGALQSKLAVLEERRSAISRELGAFAHQASELEERGARAAAQIRQAEEQQDQTREAIRGLEETRLELLDERGRLTEAVAETTTRLEEMRHAMRDAEQKWDETRVLLDSWKDRHSALEIEKTQIEADLRHLTGSCLNELSETIESVCLKHFEVLSSEQLDEGERECREIREKMDLMGAVNMMAVDEYQEAEDRFVFLSTQRQDLLDSIRDTAQAIEEIDSVCRRQFKEAFDAINTGFTVAFVHLFGGGHGELRLLEEAGEIDAGVEIVAQPPGKKLQNVLLLSGGEKALTALALLIALFRYKPSPFCVLDEVDAPLDEANVDRFASMVREMSRQTQFIVITHSKRTMETASTLYGVTMEEPGISKIVSVRLN